VRRISTWLTVAVLLVALVPALPLSLVVRNLLDRSLAPALDVGLEEALQAGIDESREVLRRRRVRLADLVARVENGDDAVAALVPEDASPPRLVLIEADDLPVAGAARDTVLQRWAVLAELVDAGAATPPPGRVGRWLTARAVDTGGATWGLAVALPEQTVERAGRMTEGLGLLRALRSERARVLESYVGPFLVIYCLLILVALGAGGLLARRIARPLEAVVAGTRRVAAGDLRTPVEASGPGEVGDLVVAFNQMLGRLDTQRRDLARLERAAAWRGMARTLAHEVKNPLTPILLAVQETHDNYQGDDADYRALLDECLEIVREEIESLRRLVREFGDFARLPRPEPQVHEAAEPLLELRRLYGERVEMREPPAGDAWIDADAMRRVLVNLVDNGLSAAAEAGRPEKVTVDLRLDEERALYRVQDIGTGIPPENRERIFEPDFTTKGERGMGLGLAICASIVAGHGGTIELESELGEGTTFTIEIPRRPPPDQIETTPTAGVREEER